MKRVFLDTNILMDAVEFREHGAEANLLLDMSRRGMLQVCAAVMSFATLSYLLRHHSKDEIHQIFQHLDNAVEVLPMDDSQFHAGMEFGPVRDFEDMLQYQCAKSADCDVIVTNNGRDFVGFCDLPVMTAAEFLGQMIE